MVTVKAKPDAVLAGLDPALRQWFIGRYGQLSQIQSAALPHTLAGQNTLILAPTGSGKTFAAFFSVVSKLAGRARAGLLPNLVSVIYISPLKALDNDIGRNLRPVLEAVNATLPANQQIRLEVRTGDTSLADRARQQRHRPHLLMTTPESFTSMLSQSAWKPTGARHVLDPDAVIVDEIHSFAENKRGSLLALSLERLEHRIGRPLQRIGVSATAWPVEAIQLLLCGSRSCAVAQADFRKSHRLEVVAPAPAEWLPPAGHNPYRIAHTVAREVERARCSLIFLTTRSGVERLGLALKILLPEFDERIAVHHGSIDRETRLDIEQGLKDGYWKAVIASSSLEMGVDFECVDQVLLIGTPRGVSRALQRLGRSGHRVDGVAAGALIPLSLPDLLECVALRQATRAGHLDSLRIPAAPLDVLAQSILGMSIEREWPLDEAFEVLRRAGPYQSLSRADFDAVVHYLSGAGRVLGPYGTYGKIELLNGCFKVAGRKVARDFYMNMGVITDDLQVKIVSPSNRRIGEVEEGFLSSLQPNEAFIIAGKTVRVRSTFQNVAVVEPAQGESVKTPRWMGNKMALTAQLAREELQLRRDLRDAFSQGGPKACLDYLTSKHNVDPNVADRLAGFIERHTRAMPVPVDSPVLAERVVNGRNALLLVHIVGGRAVNRSLAWVVGSRLAQNGRVGERPGPATSIVANFDDHSFLLSMDARVEVNRDILRRAFNPACFLEDLRRVISTTETLGRSFRRIAEIGQLLPRRTLRGHVSPKASSWNGTLLYKTLMEHEPGHPLVREAVREVLEDQCDAPNALAEAARVFDTPLELFDLERPSPFALPLFSAFNREVLLAADPDRALDDLVTELYADWGEIKEAREARRPLVSKADSSDSKAEPPKRPRNKKRLVHVSTDTGK